MTKKKSLIWSASQLKSWQGCRARWGFRRIRGIREEDTAATSNGTAVHRQMELWNNIALKPTLKQAKALIPYAPMPGIGHAEVPIWYEHNGVQWYGKIDLVLVAETVPMCSAESQTSVVLYDWKTTSGDPRYMHTPETLVDDPAANAYAWEAWLGCADIVTCVWVYVDAFGNVTVVRCSMDRDRVRAYMDWASAEAARGNELFAANVDPNTLDKNTDHCRAFRKDCPAMHLCTRPESGTVETVEIVRTGLFKMKPAGGEMKSFEEQVATVTGTVPPIPAPPAIPPIPGIPSVKLPPALPPIPPIAPPPLPMPAAPAIVLQEAGFINSPESAGKPAIATPEQLAASQGITEESVVAANEKPETEEIVDQYSELPLHELKALAVERGLTFAPRARTKVMLELLRSNLVKTDGPASDNSEHESPEITEEHAAKLDALLGPKNASPVVETEAVEDSNQADNAVESTDSTSVSDSSFIEAFDHVRQLARSLGYPVSINITFGPDA